MNRQRLKSRRLELNLTLQDVADKLGLTRATIQKYESGYIKGVDTETLEKLAQALETTPAFLMGWESETEKSVSDLKAALMMQNIDAAIRSQEANTYIIHGSEGKGTVIKSNIPDDKYLLIGEGNISELTKKEYSALKSVLDAMSASFDDE